MTERKYDLAARLLRFATRIVRFTDRMGASRAAAHLADQLLRSGTSPQLNYGEAEAAESSRDFVHKMGICLKELRESQRALLLIRTVPLSGDLEEAEHLLAEVDELIRIFAASIRTAKQRTGK